jgi:hypothetical protein
LQITQPPSANALLSVIRVAHKPLADSDFFSTTSLFHFKRAHHRDPGRDGSLAKPDCTDVRRLVTYFAESLPENDSRDKSRLSGVISCARLKDGTAVDGELLHPYYTLVQQKIRIEVNDIRRAVSRYVHVPACRINLARDSNRGIFSRAS